jgi:hypothetical protein
MSEPVFLSICILSQCYSSLNEFQVMARIFASLGCLIKYRYLPRAGSESIPIPTIELIIGIYHLRRGGSEFRKKQANAFVWT